MTADGERILRERHPGFRAAVLADAHVVARHRLERHEFRSGFDALAQVLRLAWDCDAFAAQVLYRAQAALHARRVPILPRLLHKLAMLTGQVSIGTPVLVEPGVYIVHGSVVIDGLTTVGAGTVIAPFVTIGLADDDLIGPTIGPDVRLGTGAKIIGPVTVAAGARVAANAVVVRDVAAGQTVAGVPAEPLRERV